MSIPLNIIHSYFETGDFPTEAQFRATFESFWHKDQKIPQSSIEKLNQVFQNFASAEAFDSHLDDADAHVNHLALLDGSNLNAVQIDAWKQLLAIQYLASIDGDGVAGNVYSKEQMDEFIEMLNNQWQQVIDMLQSNDITLDELQEIVDFIKQNRADIEALQAISIGVTTEDKVNMVNDYPWIQSPATQQVFNEKISERVQTIIESSGKVVQIATSTTIPHTFGTDLLMVEVRDSVTGKRINCEDYVTSTTVQINFLDDVPNPANVLIKKVIY